MFLMLMSTVAFADEAMLPTFDVTLIGQNMENANRGESEYMEYPLFQYNEKVISYTYRHVHDADIVKRYMWILTAPKVSALRFQSLNLTLWKNGYSWS